MKSGQIFVLILFLCFANSIIAAPQHHKVHHHYKHHHKTKRVFHHHQTTVHAEKKPSRYKPVVNIDHLFATAIAQHAFPGGCLAVGDAWHVYVNRCYGYHTYQDKHADNINSLFDIASLTKVVATTPAIMLLVQSGKIHLDDKVIKYLPGFRGPTAEQTRLKSAITIRDLLSHTSGLASGDDLDNRKRSLGEKWQTVLRTRLVAKRHQRTIYSDVNFLLLGLIVEKVTHKSLDQFTHQQLYVPLWMSSTGFNPPHSLYSRAVPSIYLSSQYRLLQGEVQDPNARALAGVAGNAGLFSTSSDLIKYCQMILRGGLAHGKKLLSPVIIREFSQRANIIAHSSRALGWDTAYYPYAPRSYNFTAGLYIDSDAIGHSGYTGTSLWISPKNKVFVVLLTNRLPLKKTYLPHNMRAEKYWRQRINSAAWQNLGFENRNRLYAER